jgi:hypothetical protein
MTHVDRSSINDVWLGKEGSVEGKEFCLAGGLRIMTGSDRYVIDATCTLMASPIATDAVELKRSIGRSFSVGNGRT